MGNVAFVLIFFLTLEDSTSTLVINIMITLLPNILRKAGFTLVYLEAINPRYYYV
jgi:hypothetical protein